MISNDQVEEKTGSAPHMETPSTDTVAQKSTHPYSWPLGPHTLRRSSRTERLLDVYDVLLCLFPALLLVKAGLCVLAASIDGNLSESQNHGVTSHLTLLLTEFNSQLTTAFTILFVAIMSTFVRRLALWKAEKGASLGDLEKLQASVSLPATLLSICFYYLGSQASQREYVYRLSSGFADFTVSYQSPTAPSLFQYGPNDVETQLGYLNALFVTNFITKQENMIKGQDVIGYPLTPYLGLDNTGGSAPLKDGWYDVSQPAGVTYASFGGPSVESSYNDNSILVWTIGAVGDFTYYASYIEADCTLPIQVSKTSIWNDAPELTMMLNLTSRGSGQKPGESPRILEISYVTNTGGLYLQSLCSLTTTFVEIQAQCDGIACSGRKMRLMPGSKPKSNLTPFDDDAFALSFFTQLQNANGPRTSVRDSSAVEQYMNPTQAFEDNANVWEYVSNPLTQLINSYYILSCSPYLPELLRFGIEVSQATPKAESTMYTIMHGAGYAPEYFLSPFWLAIDVVSCILLLLAAVAAHRLRKITLAPDIFGYVSSLTRDNPNINLPPGGSHLSGIDRARLLRHIRVQIADVEGLGETLVGRVGLRNVGENPNGTGRLLEARYYI